MLYMYICTCYICTYVQHVVNVGITVCGHEKRVVMHVRKKLVVSRISIAICILCKLSFFADKNLFMFLFENSTGPRVDLDSRCMSFR